CGFLGLPRLEALAHAAETLMGKFRDGPAVTGEAVTLVLSTMDRLKQVLRDLEQNQQEPEGSDADLIGELERMAMAAGVPDVRPAAAPAPAKETVGTLVHQVLERPLRPGEVSLDELERAFREAAGPDAAPPPRKVGPKAPPKAERKPAAAVEEGEKGDSKVAAQSIRVNVETLENLMTMVSELVLTRNQLLEIVRRHEDSEF